MAQSEPNMYKIFDDTLEQESGIDFVHYIAEYGVAGNTPGIYSDVALLLYSLAKHESVETVLEFGSGISTCVLTKAAQKFNKDLYSMEWSKHWYGITRDCMKSLSIEPNPGDFVCTDNLSSKFVKIDKPQDLVFVDGPLKYDPAIGEPLPGFDRLGACDLYGEWIKDAVLCFDDAQTTPHMETFRPWLRKFGRGPELEVWFNPTGRGDRHQLLSFPTKDHPLWAVVDSCRL